MKNKKIGLLLTILLTFVVSITGVKALTVGKLSLTSFTEDENPLKLANYTNSSITVTNPEGSSIEDWTHPSNMKYKLVKIPQASVNASGTVVKVKYPKVGTYEGKEIGANVTYTVYKYRAGHATESIASKTDSYEGIVVAMPYNLQHAGTGFFNSEYNKVSYEFFYVKDNTTVNVTGAYFTLSSLNYKTVGEESVLFDSTMTNRISKVYTYEKKNNINVITTPGTSASGVAYSLAIAPTSDDDFCDGGIGRECYLYNSAIIKYNGKMEAYLSPVNTETGLGDSAIWFSPSSATMNVKPEDPVKYINKTNSRVKKAEYKIGDQVVFEVDQKVSILGEDVLVRYSAFKMVDELPEEVDYVSAKLYDKDGKEVTKGTATYDKSSHKVTWTANSEFLTTMPLKGETYTLKVTAKVNSNMKDVATNKAYSIINNYETRKDYATIYTNKETVTVVTVPPTKANAILIGVGASVLVIVTGILIYLYHGEKSSVKK